jgi:hypothetical protein
MPQDFFRNFGIRMACLLDIQLLGLKVDGSPPWCTGLEKTIYRHCKMSANELELARITK